MPAPGAGAQAPEGATRPGEGDGEGAGSSRRTLWWILLGVVLGAVLTLIVVALGTGRGDAVLDEEGPAIDLPEIDPGELDTIIDRLLERIRDLFGAS